MWDNLPPEKLLQLRIAQADIIICWIIYILKIVAISLAAVFLLSIIIWAVVRKKRKRGAMK
ncbi:MAG: hypothetical protein IKO07_06015 [Clostridia bacterium]|nr:hypothetical protein [Clostridia bacterium]